VVELKLSEVLHDTGKQILVILGNGMKEKRILSEIAPKYNGTGCTLVLTSLPYPYVVKRGISALEAVFVLIHSRYKINNILFIVDKEHIKSPDLRELSEKLKKHGCIIRKMEPIGENAWVFEGVHGLSHLSIYVAVAGEEKGMEEEIQRFQEILGITADISERKLLKEIKQVKREELEKCFKGLTAVLKFLELHYINLM